MIGIILGFWLWCMFCGFCAVMAICWRCAPIPAQNYLTLEQRVGLTQPPFNHLPWSEYAEAKRNGHYHNTECPVCQKDVAHLMLNNGDPRIITYRLDGSTFKACSKCAQSICRDIDRIQAGKVVSMACKHAYRLSKQIHEPRQGGLCDSKWLENHLDKYSDGWPNQNMEVYIDGTLVKTFSVYAKKGEIKAVMCEAKQLTMVEA